jgi:hypothetical protein
MRRRTFLDLLVTGVAGYAVRPSIAFTAQPAAWHERLPKVELHLHLEGALPRATLWELITKYGGDPAIKSREDLDRVFVYSGFGEIAAASSVKFVPAGAYGQVQGRTVFTHGVEIGFTRNEIQRSFQRVVQSIRLTDES